MKALQSRTIGSAPEVADVPTLVPCPRQVLLRVTAAGVCHSDQFVMDLPEDQYIYGPPLTLGHEGAVVGIQATTDLASRLVGGGGEVVIVGVGPGTVNTGFFSTPWESSARAPYRGSRPELMGVLELARSGTIHVGTEHFSLEDAPRAYERLRAGTIRGRAVIVPDHNQHGEDAS